MARKKAKAKESSSSTETPAEEQPTPTTETPTEEVKEALEAAQDPAEAALNATEEETPQEFFASDEKEELDLDDPIEEVTSEEAAQEAAPPEEAETPPEEPTPAGEEAPPVEPTPPVEEPAPAAAPPAEEPPAETPTAPVPVAAPELTAEQVQQQYQTWRGEQEAALAAHHYAIDEETAQRLNDEPGVAIPQLMARVHVDSMVSTLGYVANQLPAMIDQAMQRREARSSNEDTFFERWPDLKAAEHGEAIGLIGNAYRQANPGATPEQFIRDVGAQTMVAFGLALGNAPVAEAPQTPAAKPFTPANASPPSSSPAPQKTGFAAVDDELFGQGDELDLD